eukprot:2918420-Rhodomonas_salina.1
MPRAVRVAVSSCFSRGPGGGGERPGVTVGGLKTGVLRREGFWGWVRRLRDEYDAIRSGRYRGVHQNLRLQSVEAWLGLSSFVWELLLQLTPMAKLRTEGGHTDDPLHNGRLPQHARRVTLTKRR